MNTYTFPLLLTLALLASSPVKAADEKPAYSIKEDAPRTGSSIRKDRIQGFEVANNLPYERLSAADRQALHSLYESLPEGDEPPFPLAGLQAIYKPLSKANSKLYELGKLDLVAIIDATGQVQEVKIYQSPSKEMTKFASSLLNLIKFKPAKCAGKPCVMEFPVETTFTYD